MDHHKVPIYQPIHLNQHQLIKVSLQKVYLLGLRYYNIKTRSNQQ